MRLSATSCTELNFLHLPDVTPIAVRPVCGPCSNSAKLYQEAPQCEWTGGSTGSVKTSGEFTPPEVSVGGVTAARPPKQLKRERQEDNNVSQVTALQARIGVCIGYHYLFRLLTGTCSRAGICIGPAFQQEHHSSNRGYYAIFDKCSVRDEFSQSRAFRKQWSK